MSFGTFFKRKSKIDPKVWEKSQPPVLYPNENKDCIYTSTGIVFSSEGNEDQLDRWASEQAKIVDLEQKYLEQKYINEHKTTYHTNKPCRGCGAPPNLGYKCQYCGTIYSKSKTESPTAEDIAEAIWNAPVKKDYSEYWKQSYQTRRCCK